MPGGVTVGDSGLCCCGPVQCVTSIVRAQSLPIVCWFISQVIVCFDKGGNDKPCHQAQHASNILTYYRLPKKERGVIKFRVRGTPPRVQDRRRLGGRGDEVFASGKSGDIIAESTNNGKLLSSNNWRHILNRPTTTETGVAYDNFTSHAINTGYINSTKDTSS